MRRIGQILLGALALIAVAGCPAPPKPVPNRPDGADAIAPAPPAPDFAVACANGAKVCRTFDLSTCKEIGSTMSAAYRTNLAAATDCPSVKAADPGATSGGLPLQHGR
jgi:hypothetical protein